MAATWMPPSPPPMSLQRRRVLNQHGAQHLFLSDKTIARHLSNIFTKTGVSTRAATTAFAFEHDMIHRYS